MAIKYYDLFQGYLVPYLDVSQPMLQFISFAVIFIVFNIVIHILGIAAKNVLNILFLDSIDHVVGAGLGLIKGTILIYFLIMILDQIPYNQVREVVDSSYLANNVMEMTPIIQKSLEDIFKRP
jgi:membrane protein required for colicin V production